MMAFGTWVLFVAFMIGCAANLVLQAGEDVKRPDLVKRVAADIRAQSDAPIYLYTAKVNDIPVFMDVLDHLDGVTLTLPSRKDVVSFRALNDTLLAADVTGKSLRLNVFSTVSLGDIDTHLWQVKSGIRWIKACPLSDNEVFMRLK